MKATIYLLFIFTILSVQLWPTDRTALLSQLNSFENQLYELEKSSDSLERSLKIRNLKASIDKIEQRLNESLNNPIKIVYSATNFQSNDFEVISVVFYDWSESDYRVVGKIRNQSFVYAEWVKIYFYFYKDGILVGDDYTYIDYESYGYAGVLPYHESFFESFVDKFDFDDLELVIQYDKTAGDDVFLCDQLLQLNDVSISPGPSPTAWRGTVNNASTYSVEFPKIFAHIIRSDSLVDIDQAYPDTECQGNRTIIIDYVVDSPREAQEITLRNCSAEKTDIGGWYLGHKSAPYAYQIPAGTIAKAKNHVSFDKDDLNFTIATENEIIYLFNAKKTLIDQWTKDENDNLLQPLVSAFFDSYLNLPEDFDKIKYKLHYALYSQKGEGNIAPNQPKFTHNFYRLAPNMTHEFQFFLLDPNENKVEFQVDWGVNERTGWLGPVNSRSLGSIEHTFTDNGDYWISARSRDSFGAVSTWSDSVRVFVNWTVPVELVSFAAQILDDVVILKWRTESETNNLGFSVQRSIDNKAWVEIGFVPGHGTAVDRHFYSFEDNEKTNGIRHYRLKQIDQDGTFSYSNIISIETRVPETFDITSISPNPLNAGTRIHYFISEQTKIRIDIFDINGRFFQNIKDDIVAKGHHVIRWDAPGAPSGTYIIRMSSQNRKTAKKCLVLK